MEGDGLSILGQLHYSVQQQILAHLRTPRDIHHVSLTCKEMRELCLSLVDEVRIPRGATPQQLNRYADKVLRTFTSAKGVVMRGDQTRLSPHGIDELISKLAATKRITRLVIQELQLSSNMSIGSMLRLPQTWDQLEHVELRDTALSCPLECTEPVALDQLVRKLYAFQGEMLPHISILRAQVEEHERRVEANLLVTLKVVEALSRLSHLRSLTLVSRHLHLHDLAVAALSRCTTLATLTLQLPVIFPRVTVHGLQELPPSLSELRLLTRTPVATWQALAALAAGRSPNFRVHLEVDAEGATAEVGSVRGPRGHAADNIAAIAHAMNVPTGLAGAGRAGGGAGRAAGPGARGRGRGRGAAQVDDGPGTGLISGVLEMGRMEPLPAGGLPPLPVLHSLRFRSGAAEAPEPEDPEEEVPPNPVELREVELLGVMLAQAPGLEVLQLTNAGPLLTDLVARYAPKVPRKELHVACHSRVDGAALLIAGPVADLHLTLKGVGAAQLQSLVDYAAAAAVPVPVRARAPASADEESVWEGVQLWRHHVSSLLGGLPGPDTVMSGRGGMGTGLLVSLNLQRSHEVSDASCAAVLAALPSLKQLTLTTCRVVTSELVVLAARLRRPVRLRVVSCRLVSAAGWEKAIRDARSVTGSCLIDVKYPDDDDLGNEVEFA